MSEFVSLRTITAGAEGEPLNDGILKKLRELAQRDVRDHVEKRHIGKYRDPEAMEAIRRQVRMTVERNFPNLREEERRLRLPSSPTRCPATASWNPCWRTRRSRRSWVSGTTRSPLKSTGGCWRPITGLNRRRPSSTSSRRSCCPRAGPSAGPIRRWTPAWPMGAGSISSAPNQPGRRSDRHPEVQEVHQSRDAGRLGGLER